MTLALAAAVAASVTLGAGDLATVRGSHVACFRVAAGSHVGVGCFETRNGRVAPGSFAIAAIDDRTASVSQVDSRGRPHEVVRRPAAVGGARTRVLVLRVGDRFDVAGARIVCRIESAATVRCRHGTYARPAPSTFAVSISDAEVELYRYDARGRRAPALFTRRQP